MTLRILILSFILHKTSACDSVMTFKDAMYVFQSPDYPDSLGNGSFSCTLKIHHTPTESEYKALNNNGKNHCNDGNGGGGGSGENGGGGDGNDGNDGGDDGQGPPAICQVRYL